MSEAPHPERPLVVLDASVGVKWIKPEPGRDAALGLLADHREGRARIVVPAQFVLEVVAVAVRRGGPDLGQRVWDALRLVDPTVVGFDDELASSAFDQCRLLDCAFNDALAPALAERLGATLYTADARAHGRFQGAVILG